jgi:hypothetical protein
MKTERIEVPMRRKFDPAVDSAVFFTQMKDGTAEEHVFLTQLEERDAKGTATRDRYARNRCAPPHDSDCASQESVPE